MNGNEYSHTGQVSVYDHSGMNSELDEEQDVKLKLCLQCSLVGKNLLSNLSTTVTVVEVAQV